MPAPLTRDEARPFLAGLASAPMVLLAVSGGPDSVALMGLAADLAAARSPFPALVVATVDHGLRPGSRTEAEAVVTAAVSLGLPAHLLAWDGAKPATRLQERARHHRYALLTACARRLGASILVTAHTRDDQAETVLFRLMRGSGIAGLAGMRPEVARDGVRHLRPFLGIDKARLVATCRANGWPFVEDPANADPRFARARLRALMPALGAEGLDADRLIALARRAGEADAALETLANRAMAEAALAPGHYAAARLFAEPPAVRHRILGRLLASAVEARGSPRLDRVERLTEALAAAVARGHATRRTLHGALVAFDGADRLTVVREPPRRRSGTAAAEDG